MSYLEVSGCEVSDSEAMDDSEDSSSVPISPWDIRYLIELTTKKNQGNDIIRAASKINWNVKE